MDRVSIVQLLLRLLLLLLLLLLVPASLLKAPAVGPPQFLSFAGQLWINAAANVSTEIARE